jgi:2-dehydropantoate 2-reductase
MPINSYGRRRDKTKMQGYRDTTMNIVIIGAGAIGSLFGALLSKKNNVFLIGRKNHVAAIKKNGLVLRGGTNLTVKISAEDIIDKIPSAPDLLILTVKSYDTEVAIKDAEKIIGSDTTVLSLQNGLDNVDKIGVVVDKRNIIAGITTHGVFFSKPGVIEHTGFGETILGELYGKKTKHIKNMADLFNRSGIETKISTNINKEIWVKAIVNSSINSLTTIFQCKNGYLIKNPLLENIMDKICIESTKVANSEGMPVSYNDMIKKTKEVVRNTSENYSSMLQCFKLGKKTEIDSINGKIVEIGKKHGLDLPINEALVYLIKQICKK